MKDSKFSRSNALRFAGYWIGFFVLGQILAGLLAFVFVDLINTSEGDMDSSSFLENPGALRIMLFVGSIFTFIVPAVIYSKWFRTKFGYDYLDFKKWNSGLKFAFIGLALIAIGTPLMALLIKANVAIELPSWLKILDQADYSILEEVLDMPNFLYLILNIFLIGVLPAIGEELIFRGIIQKGLYKLMNPHWAIVTAAFIFSAIHFQFDGLFARWFLGIVLGYSFWWSKNLWVPILIHFVNNSVQTILAYVDPSYAATASNPELELPDMHWSLYIISTILVITIIVWVTKNLARRFV